MPHDESPVESSVDIQSTFNPNQIQVILKMGLFYKHQHTDLPSLPMPVQALGGKRAEEEEK